MRSLSDILDKYKKEELEKLEELLEGKIVYQDEIPSCEEEINNSNKKQLMRYLQGLAAPEENGEFQFGSLWPKYFCDENKQIQIEDEDIDALIELRLMVSPESNYLEKLNKLMLRIYFEKEKDELSGLVQEICEDNWAQEFIKEKYSGDEYKQRSVIFKQDDSEDYKKEFGSAKFNEEMESTSKENSQTQQTSQENWILENFGGNIMTTRPGWSVQEKQVVCKDFSFEWNRGFSLRQKQKNVISLHSAIEKQTQEKALEVSSKGFVDLGKNISAFSLKYHGTFLENVFQSSKEFEQGGPYRDLMNVSPKEAKQDERIRNSGRIVSFCLEGDQKWPTEPKTLFYDYIYIQALIQNYGKNLDLKDYEWFTDIEFNPKKSINCQARSVAIYKLIQEMGEWSSLDDKEKWENFHKQYVMG